MRKAVTKRIKITKSGKMLRKKSGQNHFNAKQSRKVQKRRGNPYPLEKVLGKKLKTYTNQT